MFKASLTSFSHSFYIYPPLSLSLSLPPPALPVCLQACLKKSLTTQRMKRTTRRSSIAVAEEKRSSVGSFSTKFSMPSFVRRVDKLTADQITAIERTGFGSLLHIHNQMLCKNLLVELMERWDSDKLAFILPPGEITITAMDVTLILGLRGVGDPVVLNEDAPFLDLEGEYGADVFNRKVSIATLEERLESLGGLANEDFVRAFLLFTFGTFLFPNSTGKVDSRYLSLLKDLDKVWKFAWGAAVLEDVFNWLCKRKEKRIQYVGGCLILLQIWSYEHIDVGRPNMVDQHSKIPRACQWESSRSSNQRPWFTTKFDELGENQIIWTLQLTPTESENDIVKELLEGDVASEEVAKVDCFTPPSLEGKGPLNILESEDETDPDMGRVVEDTDDRILADLREPCDISGVAFPCPESPSVSCCVPEMGEEHMEHPSSSTEPAVAVNSNSDNGLQIKNQRILEVEILELKKEVDELRKANALLRNKLTLVPPLQEENEKLRKEVEDLKRENQQIRASSSGLVARLERIVWGEDQDAAKER